MRVNRRFLYWGVFLVAAGGVLVASDLRAVDPATLIDGLRLWPLAVLAIGLAIVIRRTRWSLAGVLLASAVPGLVVGSAFAVGPRLPANCGAPDGTSPSVVTNGSFDALGGPASVAVRTGCGTLNMRTAAGNGWHLDAVNSAGRSPSIESGPSSLSVDTGTGRGFDVLTSGRDAWDLTLPTTPIGELSLVVNVGEARIDLPGASVTRLDLTANAAEVSVVASRASVDEIAAVVNVGSLSLALPADTDVTGSFRVNAGELRICAPAGLGLRLETSGTAERVSVNGLEQHQSVWQSPDYPTASHHAELRVRANFGSIELNPIGGCA